MQTKVQILILKISRKITKIGLLCNYIFLLAINSASSLFLIDAKFEPADLQDANADSIRVLINI